MCGEQNKPLDISKTYLGSPPRVRGTVACAAPRFRVRRITPACAGNRGPARGDLLRCSDHPRVCGEQETAAVYEDWQAGSPPRVRGTGYSFSPSRTNLGITPACAGNSPAAGRQALTEEDHPRVCGEQPRTWATPPMWRGSPPRVRGTAVSRRRKSPPARITPACAGNSESVVCGDAFSGDHPRVCGEQLRTRMPPSDFIGSPPRVRGTVDPLAHTALPPRITPACAGNRLSQSTLRATWKDHPRVCGEQSSAWPWHLRILGSPPRVRGTAIARIHPSKDARITPACAGNSSCWTRWT